MDDNIFQLGSIKGGKEDREPEFPQNDYVVVDIENEEWFATGFLVFTTHHVAVMKTTNLGAVPALVLPINRVKVAELCEE